MPVSIASIKRAEAGKNVLYRTVANLAFFFNIVVNELLDETPFSLLQYTAGQSGDTKFCIGRDWEVNQLQQLYHLSNNSQQTVCVIGMQGLGKTHLITHFLSQMNFSKKQALYINIAPSINTLPLLIRKMLGVTTDTGDDVIRHQVKALTNSPLSFFYLLALLDVPLNTAEKNILDSLNSKRTQEIEKAVAIALVQSCINRNISIIAIDDIHYSQAHELSFIKTLVNHVCLPFLLLLGITNVKQFTFLPSWLALTHKIHLKPLNFTATSMLADSFVGMQTCSSAQWQKEKETAIARAKGHPGILEELLVAKPFTANLPNGFCNTIQLSLNTLSSEQQQLLKLLALIGMFFNITLVDLLISKMLLKRVAHLHNLVSVGFLYPVSDGYCFRHFFIREIVMEQVNRKERQQWYTFTQDIHAEQSIDIEPTYRISDP